MSTGKVFLGYELIELGRTLIDPIRMLAEWAEANGGAILDAQERG